MVYVILINVVLYVLNSMCIRAITNKNRNLLLVYLTILFSVHVNSCFVLFCVLIIFIHIINTEDKSAHSQSLYMDHGFHGEG